MSMTDQDRERLEEIRERADKATEGPWEALGVDGDYAIQTAHGSEITYAYVYGDGSAGGYVGQEDAEFIAHARQDITWLIDRLTEAWEREERLDARIAKLEKWCEIKDAQIEHRTKLLKQHKSTLFRLNTKSIPKWKSQAQFLKGVMCVAESYLRHLELPIPDWAYERDYFHEHGHDSWNTPEQETAPTGQDQGEVEGE